MDAHDLLGDITSAGWLEARVVAKAVEPTCEAEIKWNVNLFEQAAGMLGTPDPSQLKALSLAGSHTNAVLRCFDQEISHQGDEWICHNGKLSLELLKRRDPEFYRTVQEGLSCRVLSKNVADQLPQLLSVVQRVGNTTLQRSEHELQRTQGTRVRWPFSPGRARGFPPPCCCAGTCAATAQAGTRAGTSGPMRIRSEFGAELVGQGAQAS